jgi:hypothetical protein
VSPAKIDRGYSFGASELVTNTKLSSLVDDATIAGIVNAEIDASAAISFSKLESIPISTGKAIAMAIVFG